MPAHSSPRQPVFEGAPASLVVLVVAVGYWTGSRLAFELAEASGLGAVLFAPAGLTVGALLRLPRHQWWLVLGAAGVTELLTDLNYGLSLAAAVGFAAANVVEPLVGATLTQRWSGRQVDLGRRRQVIGFVVGAAVLGPLVGGVLGATTDQVVNRDKLLTTAWQWWLGDGLGVLIVGSLLLSISSSPDRRPLRSAEAAALLVSTGAFMFGVTRWSDLPLQLMVLSLVIAAGALLGCRGVAATAACAAFALAIGMAVDDATLWRGVADSTTVALLKGQLGLSTVLGLVLAAEVAERARVAELESRAATLVSSEAQLRSVFNSIDEGFSICEVISDRTGPVDYRYLQINPLFEEMSGLVDPVGRTGRELEPSLEQARIAAYASVGVGRQTLRFEQGPDARQRWFDVSAVPVEPPGRFVLVLKDVTERRRAEATLQSIAALDAFRVRLGDELWPIHDAAEAQRVAAGLLGRHLEASRVLYFELGAAGEWLRLSGWSAGGDDDVRPHPATLYGPMAAEAVAAGRAVVASDVKADERLTEASRHQLGQLGVGAFVLVPLVRDGRPVTVALVHDAERRQWTREELALIVETTARAWAEVERARAEAALEARHRRAELIADLLSLLELRSHLGLESQTQAITEAFVPDFADYATVEAPGAADPVLAASYADSNKIVDDATADLLLRLGPHSHLAVPLDLGGRRRGVITVGRTDNNPEPFTEPDLDFLEDAAQRTGMVLAASHHRKVEHDISRRLQQALLPDEVIRQANVEIEPRYHAASELMEVGGDWYDTFDWPDGRIGLVVGDVVGHDLDAAAAMGRLRAAASALAGGLEPSPALLLEALDAYAAGPNGTSFATAFCAIIDPRTGKMTYASAGHPPALVVRPDGTTFRLDGGLSPPLCVAVPGHRRPEAEVDFQPGTVLVAYSDGLVERRGEALDEGIDRLAAMAGGSIDATTAELADRLLSGMIEGIGLEDDVVLACLRFSPPETKLDLRVPARSDQLHVLRSELRQWLAERGLTPTQIDDVVLAAGEACANAVEHAYAVQSKGAIDVTVVDHHHHLVVTIRDTGRWRQPNSEPGVRGRGLLIMRRLCRYVDVATTRRGTTVRLTIQVDRTIQDDTEQDTDRVKRRR